MKASFDRLFHNKGVALGYIDFRFPELTWREGHPKIAVWHATFEVRPSAQANAPVDEP